MEESYGLCPLAAPREKSALSKWLFSSTSVQDELFPHSNCAGFRVSAKTRACAEVMSGQIFPWAGGDNCFLSMGQPPGVTPAGISLQASEVERQLSLQVHTLREDFREKNSSSSQHIVRLESLQAEVSHPCLASHLQKVARAILTCIVNPSNWVNKTCCLEQTKRRTVVVGQRTPPVRIFAATQGWLGWHRPASTTASATSMPAKWTDEMDLPGAKPWLCSCRAAAQYILKLLGQVGRSARVFFLFLVLAKKAAILSCLRAMHVGKQEAPACFSSGTLAGMILPSFLLPSLMEVTGDHVGWNQRGRRCPTLLPHRFFYL